MKKLIVLFVLIAAVSGFCFAQTEPTDFTGRDPREREQAPQTDQMNFVPNEILVKFKDDVNLSAGSQLKSTGITGIDKVLKSAEIVKLEKLFPQAQKLKSAQMLRLPTGQEIPQPNLHNIYKITLPELKSNQPNPVNVHEYIQQLRQQPEVEYAEPNYIYSIGDFTPAGPEMTMLEAMKQASNDNVAETVTGLIPNDPLYNSQWGIPACNIDDVWNTTTGDSTAIIAILDTGVDDEHPDLKKNIWKNNDEIPGNGMDDDGNGKIDDTWGWDFINNDNSPKDDNSHGTHVAGIAAAVGNNGIGIAGANWKAKIMPIKVFQSSGKGDAATIAKGITYAATKGATVINMSFGSHAKSLTLEIVLANAYASSVLVAASGNDGCCINCSICGGPFYPAALSYVLGVQTNASFSNLDDDGPVFSLYPDLMNYELKAPGTGILSCVPGGNYREYNGTSMAAPLVAGAVSLYREQKPTESIELLFGNFINSINLHIDLEKALNAIPEPKLDIISYMVTDTIDGDGDGRPDAGETIELKLKVRNTWGQASDVKVGVEFGEFEDQSTATIQTSEAIIGSVSAYATRENTVSLKIKLAANISNERDIVFKMKTWYGAHLGEKNQQFIINAENGEELGDVMDTTLVLTPNKLWLVNSSFRIGLNGTLIIKPGTTLISKNEIINRGRLIAIGKMDSLIFIKGPQSFGGSGTFNFKYCNFSEINRTLGDPSQSNAESGDYLYENCVFDGIRVGIFNENNAVLFYARSLSLKESIIKNCIADFGLFETTSGFLLERNNFSNNILCTMVTGYFKNRRIESFGSLKYNNFTNFDATYPFHQTRGDAAFTISGNSNISQLSNNFIGFNIDKEALISTGTSDIVSFKNQYWGSGDANKIKNSFFDFKQDPSKPKIEYNPFLTAPSDLSHAITWKVLVNGKDAQDEIVEPIGVGSQRFDVYFSREMDINYTPQLTFGVRYPYNQQVVVDSGKWDISHKIWTAYKSVSLTTGDGINRIRVAGAKEVNGWEHEIPVEDRRFEFLLSAAGSASTEFMATPGLGKVNLEWNNNDLADGLGFNMYRMEHVNDSVLTKPVLVNKTLITDTLYTDFAVTPNKKYYYYYKILRTNLSETDSSKVVAAIPFTAALGDANGDLSVNVLDVTTIVAYLLNQNPQPFIFEAADVNGDKTINVLDIVATVNKVLNPGKSGKLAEAGTVNLYLQNDTLFADAPLPVGAFQFDITNVSGMEEIEKLKALQGFESGFSVKDNTMRLIVYSLTGKTIAAGNRIPLLRMKKGSGITNMIMGDKTGSPLTVNYLSTGLWNLRELGEGVASLGQNYPNPFNKTTTIPVIVNEPVDELMVRIINITGQEVAVLPLKNPVLGENLLHWNTKSHKGMLVYKLEISRGGKTATVGVKKMIVNQ